MGQNKILIVDGQFLKFGELNLIDGFLFREIFSEKEREEFAEALFNAILDEIDSGDEGYDEDYGEGYDDGYDDGQERVNLLNVKLTRAGRLEDIIKAAGDKTYQEKLFEEFDL